MNTRGSSSFSDYYGAVDRYIGYISVVNSGFIPNKLGLNLIIFILSIGGVSAAF
jgi:hypothetical protein